ncbi:CUB and zona pellucida-like domain-containing protein 1 [Lytechinus pictus]|uniref:CUB and zona pellucida-like domain-containing protein 1 n=1 Tax=Lytechinus pictus TaxID=7653 RepID=UPI0030BA2928
MALRLVLVSLAFLTITGINAQVTEEPELDTEGIILTCTDTEMIVEIPKSLLTGEMSGENVRFENEEDPDNAYCRGVDTSNDANEDIIELTTNLTACGTNRNESADEETYTNRVVSRYLDTDVISRQYAIEIPLSCSYNRSKQVGSGNVRYQLTDYTIDKTLDEEGAYTFSFDIYTDDTYKEAVGTYPIVIGLNEELNFAASVLSLDDTLDLSIRSCRATPNSDYDSDVYFDFIGGACSLDGDDTNITYLTDYRIGVEINTFRFIDEGDMVYIHCDLLVCDAGNAESLCKDKCATSTSMITGRRRRDVSSGLKTKRFTRGPLRVRRAAQSQESISRMDISQSGVSPQQEVTNAFNPWMVAMAAMATVVMAMAAMMVVVLRKVSNISAAPKRGQYKEESARLLDESEEI